MAASVSQKRVGSNLTEGSVLRGLLLFAVPIVLANLIQQLYSMVDLMVIGQFAGSSGTVGVSTGGEISDLLTPIATSFATAGQIYIAQLVGAAQVAQDTSRRRLRAAIGSLISMMFLMSLIFVVGTVAFREQILTLLNCPEEAFSQAMDYMLITTAGMPFIFGYNAVCGVLRGMGESKRPLMFIIIAAVVNIVLDLVFVAAFHLDAAGTAIATVLAQVISCVAAFVYIHINREQFDFEWTPSFFRLDSTACRVILGLGVPQAIRSSLVRFSLLWVNANVNSYGLTISATNSVGNKIQKFLDVFNTGVTQAAGAMVGQNLGARKQDRAGKTVWTCLAVSLVFSLCIVLLILTFPRVFYSVFTTEPDVIELGVVYMRIMILHFLMSAVTGSFQSMVIGSGFASLNFVIGVLDGVVCKVGFSILFATVLDMGFVGYFWGTATSRIIPGLICIAYFASGAWKTRRLLGESGNQDRKKTPAKARAT